MAALLNASPNKANASAFLKILLSEEIQSLVEPKESGYFQWIPVLNSAVDLHIEYHYQNLQNTYYEIPSQPMAVPREEITAGFDMSTDVDDCQILSQTVIWDFVYDNMLPYFKREDTYENCLNKMQNELELYLSE
jgi:hypothetical protein